MNMKNVVGGALLGLVMLVAIKRVPFVPAVVKALVA